AGRGHDDLGELFDNAELLFAIEHVNRRENLNPDVVAVAGRVRYRVSRQLMDERGGILEEEGNLRDPLPAHHGLREILRQRVLVLKTVLGGIDVDRRHCAVLYRIMMVVFAQHSISYVDRRSQWS